MAMSKKRQGEIARLVLQERFKKSNVPIGPGNVALVIEAMGAAKISETEAREWLKAMTKDSATPARKPTGRLAFA